MKRLKQDRLLRDVFADDDVERLRETSLAQMLATTRQRRRRRAALPAIGAAAAVLAAAFIALKPTPSTRETTPPAGVAATVSPRVPTISDEQLLALFADRSVALVGPPGEQTLMFLDAAAPSAGRVTAR